MAPKLIYEVKSQPQDTSNSITLIKEEKFDQQNDAISAAKRQKMEMISRKTLTCPMCPNKFTSSQSQKRHLKSIHNVM